MNINRLINECHQNAVNHGFWESETTIIEKLKSKKSLNEEEIEQVQTAFDTQRIMLIVTELAEAIEGLRCGNRENLCEEIADTVIRIADTCGGMGIDLESAIIAKMAINKNRPKLHGKKF